MTIKALYSNLTASEITRLFLYGQDEIPADLTQEGLIRPRDSTIPTEDRLTILVDSTQLMSSAGPGRFALPASFDIIKKFFADTAISPGIYSLDLIKGKYQDGATLPLQQLKFQDGLDDYAARAYIWNSMLFSINPGATFEVKANGEKVVHNLSVIPGLPVTEGSPPVYMDNFDWETGSSVGQLGNDTFLQPYIDPSFIGRQVRITFNSGGSVPVTNYDQNMFASDTQKINSWMGEDDVKLIMDMAQLVQSLWNSGTTQTLVGGKPIFYGEDKGENLNRDIMDSNFVAQKIDAARHDILLTLFPGFISESPNSIIDNLSNGLIFVAGKGDDQLTGIDSGSDTLLGGSGDDFFLYSKGDDTFNGGDGRDTADFTSSPNSATVTIGKSASSDDTGTVVISNIQTITLKNIENIYGTSHDDIFLVSQPQNANPILLDGKDGFDVLGVAATGQDSVVVDDLSLSFIMGVHVFNYQNFEELVGSAFNDIFKINSGGKKIRGDLGDDTIYVENYTLDLTGESIDGGAGNNVLVTGDYADITGATLTHIPTLTINGNYGAVTMSVAQLNGFSAINAVAGNALIFLSTGGSYNLGNLTVTGNVTIQGTTTDPVTATGSAGNDTLSGWSSSNTTLYGMAGNDTLIAGEGQNHLYGGDGDDYFVLSGITTVGDVLDGNAGYNTLDATNHTDLSVLTLRNIQKLEIENGDVGLTSAQFNQLTTFMAYGGVATLIAKSSGTYDLSGKTITGRINVRGSAGVDILVGDAKGQTLNGGAGADQLTGNGGADVFKFGTLTDSRYPSGMDRITDFTIGTDKIDVTGLGFTGITTGTPGAGQLKVAYDSYYNQTYVYDAVSGFGFYMSGNKTAITTADFIGLNIPATVTINGTSGNDYLSGGSTNDLILGMGAQDQLLGNDGNDTLDGGAGVDQLTGGAGLDVFRFANLADSVFGSAMDRIADFTKGEDKIDLTGLGFTGVTTGTPAAGQLKLTYDAFYQQTYLRDMGGSGFGVYLTGNHTDIVNSDIIGLVPSS